MGDIYQFQFMHILNMTKALGRKPLLTIHVLWSGDLQRFMGVPPSPVQKGIAGNLNFPSIHFYQVSHFCNYLYRPIRSGSEALHQDGDALWDVAQLETERRTRKIWHDLQDTPQG